jgi:hypothetical protein
MTLAIAEPTLRGSRTSRSRPLKAAEDGTPSASVQSPRAAQIYEIMLSWSPWSIMLRQQALLAQACSSMIKTHLQFARILGLPACQSPRPARR